MIKNIIFDWSGVINDNIKTTYCAATAVLKHFGAEGMTFEDFRKNWVMPYMDFYNRYLPDLNIDDQRAVYEAAYREQCPKPKDYPGMLGFLKKCKATNIRLFIVSSDPKNQIFNEIKDWGMEGLFDEVAYEILDKSKSVEMIIEKHSLPIANTLFIGDTDYEVRVGKKLKIKGAGVTWGAHDEEKLRVADPDYIFNNIDDMEKVILKNNESK